MSRTKAMPAPIGRPVRSSTSATPMAFLPMLCPVPALLERAVPDLDGEHQQEPEGAQHATGHHEGGVALLHRDVVGVRAVVAAVVGGARDEQDDPDDVGDQSDQLHQAVEHMAHTRVPQPASGPHGPPAKAGAPAYPPVAG